MGQMRSYFISKLFDVNYRMAIHQEDANRRLASESIKILLLPASEVPECYKREFMKLRTLIEETVNSLPESGMIPSKLKGIKSITAAKYIKLLVDIQDKITNEN